MVLRKRPIKSEPEKNADETLAREIDSYLSDIRSYFYEVIRARFLMDESRKRSSRANRLLAMANKKLKAIVGSMTDAQKAEAVKSTREMARNGADAAIKETVSGDNSWVHEEDNATLFFDVAGYSKPNVLVSYHSPERPSIVVDVCGSIRSNAKNLGHPVVVEAITRYASKLSKADAKSVKKKIGDPLSGRDGKEPPAPNRRLGRGLAERRLQSIYGALIAGAKSRSRRAVKLLNDDSLLHDFLDATYDQLYFNELAAIMKEAEAKTNSSRTRREAISKSLNESMPSMDHEPILEFLKNDEALPRKFTGTALQTHYIAYERGIQARSISQYKVGILRRQRWLEKVTASGQEILTKEKIKALVEGVTDDWAGELGMAAGKGVASLEITNSTLIWKEFSVD